MSENKWQFDTDIVINNKSQGTVARHLRYCGIFNENLLQIHCWVCVLKNFKISQHLAKLQARKMIVTHTLTVCLGTVMLISWLLSMARNSVVNCVTLIMTWLTQLLSWCRQIMTCQLIPSETVTERWWCAKGLAVKPFFLVAAAVYTVQSVILWLLCKYLVVSELNVHLYSPLNNAHIIRRVFFSTTIVSLWILHGSLSLAWQFVHAVLEKGNFLNTYFTR